MAWTNYEFPNSSFYDSDLRELLRMYKKLVEEYDGIKAMIEESIKDYESLIADNSEIKQRMNSIESKMSTLEAQIIRDVNARLSQFSKEIDEKVRVEIEEVNKSIANLIKNVDTEMTELTNYVTEQVRNIRKDVDKNYTLSKRYTDTKVGKLEQFVVSEDERIEKLIGDIKVDQTELVSPIDGVQKPTQDVIDEMYYVLRPWVLRAMNYDNLKLTAEEYDKLHVSAWNYDNLSKWYVREKPDIIKKTESVLIGFDKKINDLEKEFDRRITGYSPFSGMTKNVIELFNEMAGYLRVNAIESAEYDGLELTADDYEANDLTAYIYDWYARLVLISGAISITAQRYDNLLLNAYQYDAFRLSAYDYDMYAGALLVSA